MPETLNIEVVHGVLQATVSGAFSLDAAKMFFREILHRAREQDLDRILIDTRGITTEISTMARFEFGSQMPEHRVHSFKIAFVGRDDQVWPDRFFETVAVNRGVRTKVVSDTEEALNWLAECPANRVAGG